MPDVTATNLVSPNRTCAFCNSTAKKTKEHVIARCFFMKPLPEVMLTAPACDACNNGVSENEDYLHTALILSFDCAEHPEAVASFTGPVQRAFELNTRTWKTLKAAMHIGTGTTAGGSVVNNVPVFTPDLERIKRVFQKIIKGLYFTETGSMFPLNYEITVYPGFQRTAADLMVASLVQTGALTRQFRNNVFRFVFAKDLNDPAVTLWVMSFYNGYHSIAITHPPGTEASNLAAQMRAAQQG